MTRNLKRRTFLKGLLTTAAITPLTLHGLSRSVFAAGPKRALFVYVPDGCIPSRWHPQGSEHDFTLAEMSAPLERIKDRLVFVSGLDMYAGGATHEGGIRKVLTGAGDVSIDVHLGQLLKDQVPHSSVHLGVGSNFENGSGTFSFIGPEQEVKPDDNPLNAFDRVFGGVELGGGEGGEDLAARRKQSVLDALVGDLEGLRSRLSGGERARLDTHLDSLREVEQRIVQPVGGSCAGGVSFNAQGFAVIETDYYPKTYHKEEHLKTVGDLQMDLAVQCLACDMTRVVSLMWSHPVSPTHILETGVGLNNHDASHFGDPSSATANDFVVLKRWMMDRFAELIDRLEAVPTADGTLLDDTLVFLCSELGDANNHDHRNMPFVLAGGAGGALETGRYLDYSGSAGGENEAHTKLLVSIANAMGSDIDEWGYTGHGKGPLDGLLI